MTIYLYQKQAENMAYLKEFQKILSENDYHKFLQLWEEYCYSDEPDADELIAILQEAKESELAKNFGQHVMKALPLYKALGSSVKAHEVLKLIFDIETTNTDDLADLAIDYLKQRYPNDKYFMEKLRLVGLRNRENFQGAIRNFDLLTHIGKGKFVFHTGGWGTGEILDFSLIREDVTLEFDLLMGNKTLSFTNAMKTLIPLPDDHFLARRFGQPDELEKQAKEDPSSVLFILLKDLGPKTAAEIKDEMSELVIPANEWSRWWQTARAKIKKDTRFVCPENLKEPFSLRTEEVSREKLFQESLQKSPSISEMIEMVYDYLRDFSDTLKKSEFKASLKGQISQALHQSDITNAQKLQLLFFLKDLDDTETKDEMEKMISSEEDIPGLIHQIHILSLKKRALQLVRKVRPDWKEKFFSLLFDVNQNLLRDYLFSELAFSDQNDLLKEKIKLLLKLPADYPYVFFWYFQKCYSSPTEIYFSDAQGKSILFESLLNLLASCDRKPEYHDLTKKIIHLLTAKRYQLVRDIMSSSSREQVKEFLLLSSKSLSLTDHDKKIFQSIAEVSYPDLFIEKEKKEEEDIIWTTQAGFEKVKKRIEELHSTEIVQNAREIEEAASHGDLRENAEYKAALEKRSRLSGEYQTLTDQAQKAQLIHKDLVSKDTVGPGNMVVCENSKKGKITIILLGPWDADPEKNILSSQSMVAKAMIGKKVGESFSFQGDKYRILEIKNYFEENPKSY